MNILLFLLNSVLFGIGLAMDAFSVSLANGLHEPDMKHSRAAAIAGVFAGFQFLMPMIGWFCVRQFFSAFSSFQRFIPWIALFLLLYIGGKMLLEGLRKEGDTEEEVAVGAGALFLQGVATSIDALSVGFTIADYLLVPALAESAIIGAVTFVICWYGLKIGSKVGMKLADKASVLGGIILILIGIEIFVKGILG